VQDTAPATRSPYINRELSWLDFNARVLALAEDATTPLLERAKFLAIFASNLDEFYMVRVAGLKRQVDAGLVARSPDGLTPREQLSRLAKAVVPLVERHAALFSDQVMPALANHDIHVVRWTELTDAQRGELHARFERQIFPVVTPLAVDPAHPFPYISNLSLNLAVLVRDPVHQTTHFARVKVPPLLPRFVQVGAATFVPVEDVIAANLERLFPGMEVVEHHAFRVTRNADLELDDDDAEDLLEALEEELQRRRFSPAVRLEIEAGMPPNLLELLMRELQVEAQDVHELPAPLGLSGLWELHALERPELKDEPFQPVTHPALATLDEASGDIFRILRDKDVLLHHPYDSYATSVLRFVQAAAADPDVLAIKQTLYRTSQGSIIAALAGAAQAGKQVVVVVEIKARFDERANIGWARTLEQAGCHVVYGLVGLKTHCKLALVVRQEQDGLRRYVHIGTGNYNAKTARIYEDFGLLTSNELLGADVTDLFNHLTGYSRQIDYRCLVVAPHGLRNRVMSMIGRETENASAGLEGQITIKVNSLVDERVIDALYDASNAGVQIDLIVRGICALRPGVPGMSENIRVRSVLGRFLEHSRIFYFHNAGDPDYYFMSSADLMHRNLDRRVEVLVRIDAPELRARLQETIDLMLSPAVLAWELQPNDEWIRTKGETGTPQLDVQAVLMARTAADA